jgi:hypothetical protein
MTDVGVSVVSAGNYSLRGWLYDSNGEAVDSAGNVTYLDAGSNTVTLSFDGLAIGRNKVDGPYQLRDLVLRYEDGTPVDFIHNAYSTSALSHTSFQQGGASFTGAYEIQTRDMDGDQLLDYLIFGVNVTALVSGNYTVAGSLCDCNGTVIADACSFGFLSSSLTPEVFLAFSGFPIYQNGVNGPYTLSHLTLYDENNTVIDYVDNARNTTAFNYIRFVPEFTTAIVPVFIITTFIGVLMRMRSRKPKFSRALARAR